MKKGKYFKQERQRIYDDRNHDPYLVTEKYAGPVVCNGCGALFKKGRWTWDDIPDEETNETVCPACRRVDDNHPAGFVELSGDFYLENREEILNLVDNIRRIEVSEHPLERIMAMTHGENGTRITTTGMHIARRIGDAVANAYQGDLDCSYDAENFIRVRWHR